MHGRLKSSVQPSAEEVAAKRAQIGKYVAAKDLFLSRRQQRSMDARTSELTAKLIELNPDFYSLWALRKEQLQHSITALPDRAPELCAAELVVAEKGLRRNPKCYSAWHHRLWVLDRGHSDLSLELKLCGAMLDLDARNFLCWNHRRAVAARANARAEDEFAFTTTKIEQDFSNYSAWHYRTVLIPRMHKQQDAAYWQCIDNEFSLVRQALYTEPADQSGWLYHRWLLGRVTQRLPSMPALLLSLGHLDAQAAADTSDSGNVEGEAQSMDGASSDALEPLAVFSRELEMCRDLDAIEPNCKWILLTTALLLAGREAISRAQTHEHERQQQRAAVEGMHESVAAELASLFDRLILFDPLRTNYYRDVHLDLSSRA